MFRPLAFAAVSALMIAAPAWAQTPPATAPDQTAPTSAPGPAPAPAETQIITPNRSADIVANLKASGQFTTLLRALDGSGLTALLQKPGNFTLFAPTDAAFAALPAGVLTNLMMPANAAQLQAFVAYHVVNTRLTASEIKGHAASPVPTVINKPVTVDGLNGAIKVNDATVLQSDVPTSNGVIYVIDKVLTAPQ